MRAWPGRGQWLPPLEHRLTHVDWTLQPLHWRLPARGAAEVVRALGAGRWFTAEEALALGLPAPVRRWFESTPDRPVDGLAQPATTFLSRR